MVVQLFYAAYFFWPFAGRAPEAPADAPGPDTEPVSIIVCARNELPNLRCLLPLLLKQDYPAGFEVILIDDRSEDDTYLYAQQLAQYYHEKVRLVSVARTPRGFAPKKYALTLGVKTARYPRMLFTDADCIPATDQWLRLMQRGFAQAGRKPAADLVVGFSAYAEAPGFLNQLIRFETLLTAAQYLSFAWRGWPYMGVGRNLAYTRACFTATKGYASHIRQLSGDDDLLVQDAVRQGQQVAVVADPAAHTLSEPAATWAVWWHQKRRHLSAGRAYRLADRLRVGTFLAANMLFYLAVVVLVFSPNNWIPLAVVCTLRTLFVSAVYARLSRRLQQSVIVGLLPVLDLVYFFQYLALGISLFLNRTLRWK
ncbi:Glycosyltransferase, catalytic subunit of cellulose synthase and poly-beta-1,6-N-acetylglucosamine synthase [Hymenobacter arizonensis]|uniref:Glycosyltransferase, catalytic subunit of cellulose synthase and poly-beta-1,6-N-acetylglucosamine synthase n=1 Tax=Hymenobacter arizonensis TaxID=1227077 RepID=A0A1I5ZX68_HYMAR|nr:Glycosyltransferase, catalytic subunit of cellulose synthase and poly-beta-1,6-N-acetylglucosamine synthase [Hymenobacter arizonensis]